MVVVRSATVSTLIDGGIEASACGSSCSTRCSGVDDVRARLLVDQQQNAVVLPFCQAVSSVFSGPSTATPMSRMRTGAPFL